jgi:hypothetical protein
MKISNETLEKPESGKIEKFPSTLGNLMTIRSSSIGSKNLTSTYFTIITPPKL